MASENIVYRLSENILAAWYGELTAFLNSLRSVLGFCVAADSMAAAGQIEVIAMSFILSPPLSKSIASPFVKIDIPIFPIA